MFFKQQCAQVDDAREVEDWLLWLLTNDERPLNAVFYGFQIQVRSNFYSGMIFSHIPIKKSLH